MMSSPPGHIHLTPDYMLATLEYVPIYPSSLSSIDRGVGVAWCIIQQAMQ